MLYKSQIFTFEIIRASKLNQWNNIEMPFDLQQMKFQIPTIMKMQFYAENNK